MISFLVPLLGLPVVMSAPTMPQDGPRVIARFSADARAEPADGRLLLLLTPHDGSGDESEPRFQVRASVQSAQVFGVDVDGLRPDAPVVFDSAVFGHPTESLRDVPAGEYTLQAVLHLYETFHVAHGHTLKLPMDRGEGQHWNRAPGNLTSTPLKVRFDPSRSEPLDLVLDQVIPPI